MGFTMTNTFSPRSTIQNDRSDIWGFAVCCAVVPEDLLLKAFRTALSKRSFIP
jgi:hypothetical protein